MTVRAVTVAQLGCVAKPHSEGCRERNRQAMTNDDAGQQRLHAAEQRLAPAVGQQASDVALTCPFSLYVFFLHQD